MCHNGELPLKEYYPKKKTKDEFLEEYKESYRNKDLIIFSFTSFKQWLKTVRNIFSYSFFSSNVLARGLFKTDNKWKKSNGLYSWYDGWLLKKMLQHYKR